MPTDTQIQVADFDRPSINNSLPLKSPAVSLGNFAGLVSVAAAEWHGQVAAAEFCDDLQTGGLPSGHAIDPCGDRFSAIVGEDRDRGFVARYFRLQTFVQIVIAILSARQVESRDATAAGALMALESVVIVPLQRSACTPGIASSSPRAVASLALRDHTRTHASMDLLPVSGRQREPIQCDQR